MSAAKTIRNYFLDNPKIHITHNMIRYHLLSLDIECKEPQRQVRLEYAKGLLVKVSNGVYFYDPNKSCKKFLAPVFTASQRKDILKENNYCSVCGSTSNLVIDHIIPREDKNSTNNKNNAQVLCTKCNNIKKNNTNIFFAYKLLLKEKNNNLTNIIKELEVFI